MKAIQFKLTIPRYLLGLALGKFAPSLLWHNVSCVGMREVAEPALPSAEWVRVRTTLGGICGSDLGAIRLHASPYFSPFTSSPFTFGHENVGVIDGVGAEVNGWQAGDRVLVEPTLWCRPRGFSELCPACARGEINRCRRTTEGDLAPGLYIGSCRDTGGSWSPFFVAHQSQLYALPDGINDANGLMVEPFACGIHALLPQLPADDETVLILGAGAIGLLTLAALRALGSDAWVTITARYPFQAEMARRLGANECVREAELYSAVAARTKATRLRPLIGKEVLVGGIDHVYECAGSDTALNDALRLAATGARVTLVGLPGITKNVDWSAAFLQELQVIGAFMYNHNEQYEGQRWRTYDLALHLLESGRIDLAPLVTHRFPLQGFSRALHMHQHRGRHGIIKGIFDFTANDEMPGATTA